MDPQVQASFIPKRSLEVTATRGGGFGGLLFFVTLLFFIGSLVAAGAAFGYTQLLNKQIVDKSKSLQLAEGAYDPGTIEDLVRIDQRLTQAKVLLNKHTAVSGIFAFLSSQTLINVAFSSFDYVLGDDGSAKIMLQGSGASFATVALQSDQLNGNKLLKDVVFSSITVDATGRVAFSVSATVDPSVLSYSESLGSPASAIPVQAPAASSTPTTPAATQPAVPAGGPVGLPQ